MRRLQWHKWGDSQLTWKTGGQGRQWEGEVTWCVLKDDLWLEDKEIRTHFVHREEWYKAIDSCSCVVCSGDCRHLLWLERRLNGKAAKGRFYLSQEPDPGGPCAVSLETNSMGRRKPLKRVWAREWGDKVCAVGKINNGLKEFKECIQWGTRLDKGEQETIATV